eukprot:TRINITY_DN7589_c0_g1_i6.p1 TRINITY_DN7589_c0_g1~~TRINITY_DN7589_c0_g1_i6.p1  ORF type:complete len:112 (+),score=7.35 TRINITY_DN7589_c0_g1_i6:38-337(+)
MNVIIWSKENKYNSSSIQSYFENIVFRNRWTRTRITQSRETIHSTASSSTGMKKNGRPKRWVLKSEPKHVFFKASAELLQTSSSIDLTTCFGGGPSVVV